MALMRKQVAWPDRPDKASLFLGVYKDKKAKANAWRAEIRVTEDGKSKRINIARFAREEDAARAFDRVSIAHCGHAEAETNFPAAEYGAEWAELEALGAHGAVAMEREHAAKERQDLLDKTSRFRGVTKANGGTRAKPWAAKIKVNDDGKLRRIHIGSFVREEDAARAFDRVSIAKLRHAEANLANLQVDH